MPSSRSVLSDIHDLGLDPTKEHRQVNSTGHLKVSLVGQEPEKVMLSDDVETKPSEPSEPLDTAVASDAETPKDEKKRGRKAKTDVTQ